MPFSVFVSHSMRPHDLPLLRGVCDHLSHHGITYYLAERDWRFGEGLPTRVENEIKRSDCVFGFLTREGQASDYVNQEISLALTAKKTVIPVLEKGTDLKGFRAGLDYVELDRLAPQDCATKLSARLNQLNTTDEVRSALCWAVIATAGLLFLGRT
ncbi:MAG TPA: toll/interleukin-1 receptor domain-containing protein [Burkholderiales bacterium]|nr:toll/interleukin-1 receptor domain-containing protein [Burkholderiales bacterium]